MCVTGGTALPLLFIWTEGGIAGGNFALPAALRRQTRRQRRCVAGLSNDAASQARAATAQRRRMIGMIIAAGMDHQRTPADIGDFQPWCQYRLICIAAGIHE